MILNEKINKNLPSCNHGIKRGCRPHLTRERERETMLEDILFQSKWDETCPWNTTDGFVFPWDSSFEFIYFIYCAPAVRIKYGVLVPTLTITSYVLWKRKVVHKLNTWKDFLRSWIAFLLFNGSYYHYSFFLYQIETHHGIEHLFLFFWQNLSQKQRHLYKNSVGPFFLFCFVIFLHCQKMRESQIICHWMFFLGFIF